MHKSFFYGCSVFRLGALVGISLWGTSCQQGPPISEEPGAQQIQQLEDKFIAAGPLAEERVAAGGQVNLSAGGSVALPRGSPSGVEIAVAEGTLKPGTAQSFQEWNPGISLQGNALKISVIPEAAPPQYLILRLPASDPSARIFVAGYIDADTSDLDWEPAPGSYDPQTGLVTAVIGLSQLQSTEQGAAPAQKDSAALSPAGPVTYNGYVTVAVGGQQFAAQFVLIAEEPATPLKVPFEGPPIAVRALVGAKLSNITHQPLDSLTVTSDFGPRRQPEQGASTAHKGVDYRAADSTTVYAAGDGAVVTARCANGSVNCGRKANGDISAGFIVEIDHGNGELTRYLHMTNPATVRVGDPVTGGQPIGLSDSTGGVAAHLHFEVRKNGTAVNPQDIFSQAITATIAMAIDYELQSGTQQQIPMTRGIITPQAMAQYVDIVELTGVQPGEHTLQFVIVEANGAFQVLVEVPLTVGPAGDFVGSEEHFAEITWTPQDTGLIDYSYTRFTSSFSLTAVDEHHAQGTAHLTFETQSKTTYSVGDCPVDTSDSGLVEWDATLDAFYEVQSDGSLYLAINSTPSSSPPYLTTYTRPGCTAPAPTTSTGHIWTGVTAYLVDGHYDSRDDYPLGTDETGRHFYEVHIQQSNRE